MKQNYNQHLRNTMILIMLVGIVYLIIAVAIISYSDKLDNIFSNITTNITYTEINCTNLSELARISINMNTTNWECGINESWVDVNKSLTYGFIWRNAINIKDIFIKRWGGNETISSIYTNSSKFLFNSTPQLKLALSCKPVICKDAFGKPERGYCFEC